MGMIPDSNKDSNVSASSLSIAARVVLAMSSVSAGLKRVVVNIQVYV